MYCKKKTIHFGTKTKVTRTHELVVSYAKIGGSGLNDRWFTASPLPCTLSTPALSTPASLCRLVHCRVLHSRVFSTPINMHYSKKIQAYSWEWCLGTWTKSRKLTIMFFTDIRFNFYFLSMFQVAFCQLCIKQICRLCMYVRIQSFTYYGKYSLCSWMFQRIESGFAYGYMENPIMFTVWNAWTTEQRCFTVEVLIEFDG